MSGYLPNSLHVRPLTSRGQSKPNEAASFQPSPCGAYWNPKANAFGLSSKKPNKFSHKVGIPIVCLQYSALHKDMVPSLHRTAAFTFVIVVARYAEPGVVLSSRRVVENGSAHPRSEHIAFICMSEPYSAVGVCRTFWLPLGVAQHHELVP